MSTSTLKPKQIRFIEDFRSGRYKYLCTAGTAGSGKTFVDLGLLHILCSNIPGVRFFVGRKSEKNLKQTTIPSYNEMKRKTRSMDDSVIVDMCANYKNGSQILFIWCDITKDPDLNNLRGLEVNGGLFEEANQIDRKYFEIAKTRIGRWRPELCQAFILLNLNPSLGWVKELFYDNWIDGTLPSVYYFIEFDEHDARDASGNVYVENLKDLATEEYNRFVRNQWDYSVIPNQLISYEWYKQCIAEEPKEFDPGDRVLGATDPAWEGDDATVFGRMHGTHIGWWESYPKQDPDFSGILSVQRAKEFKVKEHDWVVDPIGVGSATVLKMRNDLNFEPDMFIAGAAPENTFGVLEMYNKRSEAHWLLREFLRNNEGTITHHPDFQRQVLAIRYSIDDKKVRIRPKKEMKAELGESPGYVDVAQMLIHKFKTTTGGLALSLANRQLNKNTPSASSRAQSERMQARRNRD